MTLEDLLAGADEQRAVYLGSTMARLPRVFLDTSVLIAGLASATGASSTVLVLAEAGLVTLVASEQVFVEAERNLAAKLPRAIPEYRRLLESVPIERVPAPLSAEVAAAALVIHGGDAPILAAAIAARVDALVTLDRKHFVSDGSVGRWSGLRIMTPGSSSRGSPIGSAVRR